MMSTSTSALMQADDPQIYFSNFKFSLMLRLRPETAFSSSPQIIPLPVILPGDVCTAYTSIKQRILTTPTFSILHCHFC